MKRFSVKMMLLCLMAWVTSTNVFAQQIEIGGVTYYGNPSKLTAEVTAVSKDLGGDLVIPATVTYDGKQYTVTRFAAKYCKNLTSVTLPNTVKEIGKEAFWGCASLTSVNLPDSLTSIGEHAFTGCTGLPEEGGIRYAGTCAVERTDKTLTTYSIKEGTRYLHPDIFKEGSGMTSVRLPQSLQYIGTSAFYSCSKLTSVEIPDGVTKIDDSAFCFCYELASVRLPESLTSIGRNAFQDCRKIESISIPEGVTGLGMGVGAFSNCTALKSVKLPSKLTYINNGLFGSCTSLTSIVIPDSVTGIGSQAFMGCTGLESITLPENLSSIGDECFKTTTNCSALKTVTLKSKELPAVGTYCFTGHDLTGATLWVDETLEEACRTTYPWDSFGTVKGFAYRNFTLTAAGLATGCADRDLDFSGRDDVKAYIASGFNPTTGKVLLTRVYEIPAATGFILRGAEGTYKLPAITTDYLYANLLVGTSAETDVPETDGSYTNYVLGNGDNGLGFYLSQGGKMQGGKAYLHIPTAAAAKLKCIRFSFADDEATTGFIPVKILTSGSSADAPVYNLNGQRKPGLSKGMNIRGGRKVWVR